MLRALVLGLVLANVAFFLWSQGHLRGWGLAPDEEREPERVQRQIAPDALRLLERATPPGEAPPADSATPAPGNPPPTAN
jgi:hypothetical protein